MDNLGALLQLVSESPADVGLRAIAADLMEEQHEHRIVEPFVPFLPALPCPPWNPARIPGAMWLDASQPGSLFQDAAMTIPAVKDGDPIAVMADLSGNGNHLRANPRATLRIVNGIPSVGFDFS